MAAIAVVYPCLLAYMIYVHNKKGGLEAPQILMKYGHFYTGARRSQERWRFVVRKSPLRT